MLQKQVNRLRRKNKVRSTISGTSTRPRLSVYRSTTHIYAQIIDDISGTTLVESSDLKIPSGTKCEKAKKVGEDIAQKATSKNINNVVFDRNGFLYHWRVKLLADAARTAGLEF